MLLDRVIPLSLLHLPFIPFSLKTLIISPSFHCSGNCLFLVISLTTLRYIRLVFWLASMRAMLGILSGPVSVFVGGLGIFPVFHYFCFLFHSLSSYSDRSCFLL